MPLPYELVRASRRAPCPVCRKPDWCVVQRDGSRAWCCRVDAGSERYSERLQAWEHLLTGVQSIDAAKCVRYAPRTDTEPDIDAAALNAEFQMALTGARLDALCDSLGIDEAGLGMLGVGYSEHHHAYTFPMKAWTGKVIGIRLRNIDGRKWAVRGSRNGLFIPETFSPTGNVFICEGPTDTAACLGIGLEAVGRSSCRGEVDHLCRIFERARHCRAVIVADADGPGVIGASELANKLSSIVEVRIIQPIKCKDVREWITTGASAGLIGCLVSNAVAWKPQPTPSGRQGAYAAAK